MPVHGATMIVTDAVVEQPSAVVPVTLYTLLTVGVITNTGLVAVVNDHVKLSAPLAVSVLLSLRHMFSLCAVNVVDGNA